MSKTHIHRVLVFVVSETSHYGALLAYFCFKFVRQIEPQAGIKFKTMKFISKSDAQAGQDAYYSMCILTVECRHQLL